MQPQLLLISPGQSYRLAPYLKAAERLGVALVIVSDSRYSLTREVAGGIQGDFARPEALLESILTRSETTPFRGVVASDDSTVELAARIATTLGLPSNSIASATLSRRKDLARRELLEAGLPVPAHWVVELNAEIAPQLRGLPYPVVLKPISLSASRGVIRADTPAEALRACQTIARIIAPLNSANERETLLIERYLPGREVALEGFLQQGTFTPLALFDKPDPLTGPYFEETYYITPSRLPGPIQRHIERTVADACRVYGLHQGPVHAELRIDRDQAWILEIASRTIGGECSRSLDAVLARPLEEYVLAAAMGSPLPVERRPGASGVLMIPIPRAGVLRRINGIPEISALPHITDIRISMEPGQVVETLPEASSYLGFIYSAAATPEAAEQALRDAHAVLEITIDPLLNR
ncbi:ATP-grasp domain-containing protein [Sedimenticola hydrogenitrophicus]|uniref:ATP-grasp domain-containing protein n=1 Tax=Sedimenticola hydrogenitrophicus TaxID=2967975 RepID=UPI0023B12AC7|nr:ATP-grasp domain-containing protein [Sedimenticola hydrogenitrophicus]